VYHCHNCRTVVHTQHRTHLTIFLLILQTVFIVQMMSIGRGIGSVSERIFKIQSTFGEVVDKSRSLSPAECAQDRDVALRVAFPSTSSTRVKGLRPTRHKIGHFERSNISDFGYLPFPCSQSVGVVLKKLNLTQLKQTRTKV